MKYSWVHDPHGMAAGAEVGVKTTSARLTAGSSSLGPSVVSLLPQSRGGWGGDLERPPCRGKERPGIWCWETSGGCWWNRSWMGLRGARLASVDLAGKLRPALGCPPQGGV